MDVRGYKLAVEKGGVNLYILHGEDIALQGQLIQMHNNIVRCDNIGDLISNLKSNSSLFHKDRNVYVIRDSEEFIKNDTLWDTFKKLNNTVILTYSHTIDKKTKFYKRYKDVLVECNKLSVKELKEVAENMCLEAGVRLPDLVKFINACDCSYGIMTNELDKVLRGDNELYNDILTSIEEVNVFNFIDSLTACRADVIRILDKLLMQEDSNAVGIMTLLNTRLNQLYQFKNNIDPPKMNPWAYKNMTKINAYSSEELCKAIKYTTQYLEGAKRGVYDPTDALYMIVFKLLNIKDS